MGVTTSTAYGSYYLKWEMQMLNFGLLSGWNCSIHCEVKLTSRASGGVIHRHRGGSSFRRGLCRSLV